MKVRIISFMPVSYHKGVFLTSLVVKSTEACNRIIEGYKLFAGTFLAAVDKRAARAFEAGPSNNSVRLRISVERQASKTLSS